MCQNISPIYKKAKNLQQPKNLWLSLKQTFACLFIFCGTFNLYSQATVNFSADNLQGCSPISVSFTNLSEFPGSGTFLWNFGNGNTSTAPNPQTTYLNVGEYTVSLIVYHSGTSDTLIRENYIKVHPNPVASFELVGDTIGCSPFEVSFNNNSTNTGSGDLTYIWSLGDGSRSEDEHPVHTYHPAGVFDVTLLVQDESGCSDAFTISDLVHVEKPAAAFGIDNTFSCSGTLNATLNNLTQSRPGYSSVWNFGDGNVSVDNSPSHLYESVGTYSIKLTITDDIGCKDSIIRNNLVQIIKTEAAFTISADTVCPGQVLRFTNSSRNATAYTWRFGDGTTSSATSVQRAYTTAGDYDVWLIARNGTCRDSIMKKIHVERVVAAFDVSDNFICQLPKTISYQNNSENAVSYSWKFGNRTVSTQQNPQLTFPEGTILQNGRATFSDTLIVTSKHGCRSTSIKTNSVEIHLPQVRMNPGTGGNAGALSGCVPMNLTFTDQTSYNTTQDEIISRQWRVGNGPLQSGASINTLVTSPNRIPVQLIVTTARGCVQSNTETINAGQEVDVDFRVVGNYENCASQLIQFEILSPPTVMRTREIWDFGDESEVPMPMPSHNYIKTGEMNVSLTIFNNGCPSQTTKNNLVKILGPYAEFTVQLNCNKPLEYRFVSNIIDATAFEWDFGDGSPVISNIASPVHTYTESGNYLVKLTAVNTSTGCNYISTREVYVRNLKSEFVVSEGVPCLKNTLILDGGNSQDTSPFSFNNQTVRYLWILKEENITKGTSGALQHKFTKKGVNTVSLIVQDANGCRDTMQHEIFIHQPAPDFEANYKVGCMPVTFNFTDKTVSESPLVSWLWTFGDGNTSSIQHPEYDYNGFGSYNVSLEVSDEIGCTNKITKNQVIQAIFPDATFAASKSQLCIDDTIELYDISNSNIESWQWDISDGRSYNIEKPLIQFPDTGHYSVSLYIRDIHGCETTQHINDFLHVQQPPKANFIADITDSNCYPLVVQFHDTSETDYPGSWVWHFGENDNLSHLRNPFFIYNKPGYHDVTFISRSTYGCSDTIVKKGFIHVGGPYAKMVVPDSACKNTDILFQITDKRNLYDIRWDFGDGYFSTGESVIHAYANSGNIHPVLFVRSDADNTCNKAFIDTIHVLNLRALFTPTDNLFAGCEPWEVDISNTSLNSTSWQWEFDFGASVPDRNVSFLLEEPGTYNLRLIAMHDLGCRDTSQWRTLTVNPLPTVTLSADTLICINDAAFLQAAGGISYLWTPAATLQTPSLPATSARPLVTTEYMVEVTDENGCINFGNTNVTVQQIPIVAPKDTTLIIGETTQINVSDEGILSYEWSPGTNISCIDCPNPIFEAMETKLYFVAVTDTSMCFTISYPFNLTVRQIYSVDLPGAFTPNGDGINDVVFVKGWGIKELIVLRIFNRFGEVVFESSNIEEGWDGTWKGRPQPTETYTFLVQVKTHEDSVLQKTGTIRLIR
jgi:gliding motility-associated-like protein